MKKETKDIQAEILKSVQDKMAGTIATLVEKAISGDAPKVAPDTKDVVTKSEDGSDDKVMKAIGGLSDAVAMLLKKEEQREVEAANQKKATEMTKTYTEAINKAVEETIAEFGLKKSEGDDDEEEEEEESDDKDVKKSVTKSKKKSKVGNTEHELDGITKDNSEITQKEFNKLTDEEKDCQVGKSFADAMGFNAISAIKKATKAMQDDDE